MNVVAILLAAGSAKRFGSDKLLHALPHEVPIAVQAARHLKAVFPERVLAVVRPDSTRLREFLEKENCRIVICEKADEGMGASLACAVRAAAGARGFVVALADMPFIRASTIAAVRDALAAGAPLAAPYFLARRGHPVALSRKFLGQLLALKGDEGAKQLVAENERALVKIPVGDPGVIRDIDTPGDLAPPLRI